MTTINSAQPRDTSTVTFKTTRNSFKISTLYRYVNDLDADVKVTVEVTDFEDETFSFTETVQSGKTVAAQTADSDYVTEPWQRLKFSITPQTAPSSGTIYLREVHKDE